MLGIIGALGWRIIDGQDQLGDRVRALEIKDETHGGAIERIRENIHRIDNTINATQRDITDVRRKQDVMEVKYGGMDVRLSIHEERYKDHESRFKTQTERIFEVHKRMDRCQCQQSE